LKKGDVGSVVEEGSQRSGMNCEGWWKFVGLWVAEREWTPTVVCKGDEGCKYVTYWMEWNGPFVLEAVQEGKEIRLTQPGT
jgi:hypothetical protein